MQNKNNNIYKQYSLKIKPPEDNHDRHRLMDENNKLLNKCNWQIHVNIQNLKFVIIHFTNFCRCTD